MGLLSLFKKEKQKTMFYVAGMNYRLDSVKSILIENHRYKRPSGDRPVYKYHYFEAPCTLVPEPRNQVDKNAIMIMCNGIHIGYVPADMCKDIKKIIKKCYANVIIKGGKYKEYDPDDNEWVVRESEFRGSVTLIEK